MNTAHNVTWRQLHHRRATLVPARVEAPGVVRSLLRRAWSGLSLWACAAHHDVVARFRLLPKTAR